MTEETGAAAPATEQAQPAPAATEQATPKPGVQQDAATENAEAKPEGEADTGDEGDKPARLTRNQRLQRKAARLSTMVAEQAARIEELERNHASKADADLPKASDYPQGEYDPAYLSDLAAHKVAKKFGSELIERDKRSAQDRIAERRRESAEEFFDRAEAVKARIPDYDAAISAFAGNGGSFAQHVIEELQDSEHGPMLVYELAKNPQKAAELNAMSARDAAREIGRMEAKVSLPQPRTQTKAPAPLSALKGGASPGFDPRTSDDMDAYVKWRKSGGGKRAS